MHNKKKFKYWFWEKRGDKDVQRMLYLPIGIVVIVVLINIFFEYPPMDSNTWYYSISTIIQSLAAILAVGGAFFTFKMLGTNKEINDYRNRIISFISRVENNKASNLYSLSDKKLREQFVQSIEHYIPSNSSADIEFFRVFEERLLPPNLQTEALGNWKKLFDNNLEDKYQVTSFLKESLKLIGFTIVISSFMLLGSDLINKNASYIVLTILVVMFSVSIYYIATKIVNIVR